MRLRTELSDEEISLGFGHSTDIFECRDLALRLTGLFKQIDHGSVAVIDGRWGIGKATFVRQWTAELQKMDIPSIYFDAFASDYLESPFQAIASAFIGAAVKAGRDTRPAYQNFLSTAATVGKTIASVSAKVGVKAATLGAVSAADMGQLSALGEAVTDGMADITEEAVKNLLQDHARSEEKFKKLSNSLESLPKLLRPSDSGDGPVPLLIFIDELDRCRPNFSLGIIETLKHFFRAEGLHFILVTNRESLTLSVANAYGVAEHSNEYLEKFYDFVIFFEQSYNKFDPASVNAFVNAACAGVLPPETGSYSDIRDFIKSFCSAYKLSLRQIQSYTTNVAISYLAAKPNEFRPEILVSFLAILKLLRYDLYRKAKSGSLTWFEAKDFVKSGEWSGEEDDRILKVIQFHTDFSINTNDPEWKGWGDDTLWKYNLERKRVIPYLANSVMDRFGSASDELQVAT